MDKLSRIAWLYIGAVIAAAVIVLAKGPYAGLNWSQIGVLGLLLVACESSATLLNARGLAWSANTMASLAAVVLCGPVGAQGRRQFFGMNISTVTGDRFGTILRRLRYLGQFFN